MQCTEIMPLHSSLSETARLPLKKKKKKRKEKRKKRKSLMSVGQAEIRVQMCVCVSGRKGITGVTSLGYCCLVKELAKPEGESWLYHLLALWS